MTQLVAITGPIAAGKNTVADKLTELLSASGRTVVLTDVDDVAAMVGPRAAGVTAAGVTAAGVTAAGVTAAGVTAADLWPAAHDAHGALVGQWMRSKVDYVVAVGPFHTDEERAALIRTLPQDAVPLWVVIDAPVSVTFPRAQADPTRGLSRDPGFHHRAHSRYRELLPTIPADRTYDSAELNAEQIAASIADMLTARRS